MTTGTAWRAWTAAALLFTGCGEKETTVGNGKPPAATLPVASHLGIATQVPADADVFLAGYRADELIRSVVEGIVSSTSWQTIPGVENAGEEIQKARDLAGYAGDEAFVFIGPGLGEQAATVGKSYRELSAAWTGFAAGLMLDALAKKESEPDFAALEESLSGELFEKWMDAMEKDARLQVPSVVIGWHPDAEKLEECHNAVAKGLEGMLAGKGKLTPTSFEAASTSFAGFELSGREVFGEAVAKIRDGLKDEEKARELLEKLSPERIERVLTALEEVRFTITCGIKDGRVIVYLGNGKEGLRFAESPETSLAGTDDLKWTHEYAAQRIAGVAYLSEPMIRAALPWLDASEVWHSLSRAVRPPVRDERLMKEVLAAMGESSHTLAARDASAWSAVIAEDQGWRYESRGGWPDPSLDYEAPLRMTDAAVALQPALRMHWVQNRARKDLAWGQVEEFGLLVETVLNEVRTSELATEPMFPDEAVTRFMDEIRKVNRAYRDEFRAGIGDEVAFAMDLKGEMPPLPGVPEEVVAKTRVPRFLLARPVTDRAMVDASGKTFAESWRSLTAWASEASGSNLPLILPQKLESGGLVTWYPPLPFIGGDFIPGVTMNDSLWMLGTSQSMASGFARSMATPASGSERGVIVELDFTLVRAWLDDLRQQHGLKMEDLVKSEPEEMKELSVEELEKVAESFGRLQGLGYRKWLVDGKPRTSLHLRMTE